MFCAPSVSTSPYAVGLSTGVSTMVGARPARSMQGEHRGQVHLGEHVAVEHDDRVGHARRRELHRASGAERRRLDDVADLDAERRAVAEDVFDAARLVVQAQDDLVDLGNLPDEIDLVVEEGPIEDRHDRLRRMQGQRPQPCAFSAGKKNGFHDNPP